MGETCKYCRGTSTSGFIKIVQMLFLSGACSVPLITNLKSMRLTLLFLSLVAVTPLHAQLRDTLQLFFASASENLSAQESQKLATFKQGLDTVVIKNLGIVAYCDDQGDTEYNDSLSIRRARHIRDELVSLKVDPKLITLLKGKGEVNPDPALRIERARSQNRRADLVVIYTIPEKQTLLNDSLMVGDKITLQDILFEGGRHILLPESNNALKMLVVALRQKTQYSICIEGHICCSTPGVDGVDLDTGELNLSVARARVIYNYLVKQGISKERLSYKGMKADYPTGRGDKYDRRVEIEITAVKE